MGCSITSYCNRRRYLPGKEVKHQIQSIYKEITPLVPYSSQIKTKSLKISKNLLNKTSIALKDCILKPFSLIKSSFHIKYKTNFNFLTLITAIKENFRMNLVSNDKFILDLANKTINIYKNNVLIALDSEYLEI